MVVKFKLASAAKRVKTGFEPYSGPEVKRAGVYRASLKKLKYEKKQSENYGFSIVFELEAAPGDPKGHAEYDGAPFFSRTIVTQMADGSPLKEGSQNNLDNFLHAIGAGANPEVLLEDGDVEEGPIVIKRIGGKDPVGAIVNLEIQMRTYNGEIRPEIASIFEFVGEKASAKKATPLPKQIDDDEDEADLLDDIDEGVEAEDEYAAREAELAALALPALRKIATGEYDLEIKGLKKAEIVDAILEHEFSDEAAVLEDAEDDLEEEDDEDIEELEEDDEDIEEEEEDDEEARREELSAMSRVQLKKILVGLDKSARVRSKETDEDLVERILELESEEAPF